MTKSRKQAGYALLPVVFAGAAVAAVALYLTYSGGLGTATKEARLEAEQARAVAEAGFSHTLWRSRVLDCGAYTGELPTSFENHQYQSTVTPTSGTPMEITVTATLASGLTKTLTRSGVTRFSLDRVVDKQPNPAVGKDTEIQSGAPTANLGGKTEIGPSVGGHTLIQFDFSDMPASSIVYAATLTVNMADAVNNEVMDIHRVTAEWDEGSCVNTSCPADGATWLNRKVTPTVVPWTVPGGDYDLTPSTSTTFTAGQTTFTFDVTTLVRDWVNGVHPNHGLLMRTNTPSGQASTQSSDKPNVSQRPKLTISYSCPCGAACDVVQYCNADYAASNETSSFLTQTLGGQDIWGIDYVEPGVTLFGQTTTSDGGVLMVEEGSGFFHLVDLDGTLRTSSKAPIPRPRALAYVHSGPWVNSIAVNDKDAKIIYQVLPDGSLGASFGYGWWTTEIHDLGFVGTTSTGTYDAAIAYVTTTNWKGSGQPDPRLYIVDYAGNKLTDIDLNNTAVPMENPRGVAHLPGTDKILVVDRTGLAVIYDLQTKAVLTNYDGAALGINGLQSAAIQGETCEHILYDVAGLVGANSRVRFFDAGP